ncbi:hypothetical protein TrLO_g556 [Triparma laevis f. longispina]|uniref:Uncharacterized protein n=1 Tax=Triparma laevis f. longispina TaxID=1714387 RepID=A0A9W7EGE9_9STRA|nr:hypothetical protein TrLO_g556 [Triparma laevis f. longispina]
MKKTNVRDFGENWKAAQISKSFWVGAKRARKLVIKQDFRNKELKSRFRRWCDTVNRGREEVEKEYGHISGWNTSGITDMSALFGLTDDEFDLLEQSSHH